jgi:hypothetical protein
MPSFALKRFARPATLQALNPANLNTLLTPYRSYLEARGVTFPPRGQPGLRPCQALRGLDVANSAGAVQSH